MEKSDLLDKERFDYCKFLNDSNVFFVITDGDDPDEYSAFEIYMRKEDFSFVYKIIFEEIENIVKRNLYSMKYIERSL